MRGDAGDADDARRYGAMRTMRAPTRGAPTIMAQSLKANADNRGALCAFPLRPLCALRFPLCAFRFEAPPYRPSTRKKYTPLPRSPASASRPPASSAPHKNASSPGKVASSVPVAVSHTFSVSPSEAESARRPVVAHSRAIVASGRGGRRMETRLKSGGGRVESL